MMMGGGDALASGNDSVTYTKEIFEHFFSQHTHTHGHYLQLMLCMLCTMKSNDLE